MEPEEKKSKAHRQSRAGRKHDRKQNKSQFSFEENDDSKVQETAKKRNPKAFGVQSAVRLAKDFHRSQDHKSNKQYIPVVNKQVEEPPPIIVAVVGPAKVGKSTLIRSLVKHYARQRLTRVDGPITIVSGKYRRVTFIECPCDLSSMIDVAKIADLVLLMVDASYGFEMEIFEFLHIAQVHGLPRVMGVLTHLDCVPPGDKMKKIKTKLKHRFWTELYQGAKLFYLSRLAKDGEYGEYMNQEVANLTRFISVIKFRPIMWRQNHSYILVDRVEDMTDPDEVAKNKKADRKVALYGFSRGANMNPSYQVHIPGVGDFTPSAISHLPDPCPLPKELKKRSLNQKERIVYAPLTGQGGLLYDKDAVYLDVEKTDQSEPREGEEFFAALANPAVIEEKMDETENVTLVAGGERIERRPANLTLTGPEGESGSEDDDDREEEDEDESEDEIEGPEALASDSEDDGDQIDDATEDENIKQIQREIEGDDFEDDESEEEDTNELRWKDGMQERASEAFYSRQSNSTNLRNLVYGSAESELKRDETEQSDVGGLFVKIMEKSSNTNDRDESRPQIVSYLSEAEKMLDRIDELKELIADCFVTGDWGDEDATRLLAEDDELFGDFEDLESGEKHSGVVVRPIIRGVNSFKS